MASSPLPVYFSDNTIIWVLLMQALIEANFDSLIISLSENRFGMKEVIMFM